MSNYYYLYKDIAGFWRWRYVAASNGKTIADSAEGYVAKSDALHGINLLKASYTSPIRE
jgi:uncharacterized protein YegP (UPF0339 family)